MKWWMYAILLFIFALGCKGEQVNAEVEACQTKLDGPAENSEVDACIDVFEKHWEDLNPDQKNLAYTAATFTQNPAFSHDAESKLFNRKLRREDQAALKFDSDGNLVGGTNVYEPVSATYYRYLWEIYDDEQIKELCEKTVDTNIDAVALTALRNLQELDPEHYQDLLSTTKGKVKDGVAEIPNERTQRILERME